MNRKLTTIIAVLSIISIIVLAYVGYAALTSTQTVPSTAQVYAVNVGVYTDSACTINCTSVNFGLIAVGSQLQHTVYIKNTGTVPQTLSMVVSGWNPSTVSASLTWELEGDVLAAGASVPAVLTLSLVSVPAGVTSFSWSAGFTGTG